MDDDYQKFKDICDEGVMITGRLRHVLSNLAYYNCPPGHGDSRAEKNMRELRELMIELNKQMVEAVKFWDEYWPTNE